MVPGPLLTFVVKTGHRFLWWPLVSSLGISFRQSRACLMTSVSITSPSRLACKFADFAYHLSVRNGSDRPRGRACCPHIAFLTGMFARAAIFCREADTGALRLKNQNSTAQIAVQAEESGSEKSTQCRFDLSSLVPPDIFRTFRGCHGQDILRSVLKGSL